MNKDIPYYVAFSHFLGIGPMRFSLLIRTFGNVETAYNAPTSDIQQLFGKSLADRFVKFRSSFDTYKILESLRRNHILPLVRADPLYPKEFFNLSDAPICLYVKGDLNTINFKKDIFFGIVGTRRPTSYGTEVARMFSSQLSAAGCVIVSGLALGVDACAHEAALEQSGKTIAFLGCGVDVVYPRTNAYLYDRIVGGGGLVISEFPPGRTVLKGLFVARNRLISGLSRGVLVVEGTADSGSLITARYAAAQGKDVFAPPVPITSELSEAPNLLIKEGAKLVTSIRDILDELNLQPVPVSKKQLILELSDPEKMLFEIIKSEARTPDEVATLAKFPVHTVSATLTSLELKSIIMKNQEGKYQIRL